MRYVIAYDIAARITYGQSTAKDAAYAAIETLGTNGGKGSVIVVDKSGKISTPFNTRGMVRGYATANSEPSVSVN